MSTSATDKTPPASVQDEDKVEYVTGFKLALSVSSVTVVCFLLMLDQSILSTAIPQITSQFHSLPDVGWYTGVYQLTSSVLQPLTGKLYTHLRTKHVFLVHLLVFELGSLICALATSSPMLIAGRAVAGMGAAGLMNGGLQILANSAPLEKRPLYTGVVLGISQMGIVSGPLIGGALTEHATWRWCFWLNLPIGAVAFLVTTLVPIPERVVKAPYNFALVRRILPLLDLQGFTMFAPSCIMLLLALQFGGDGSHAWSSATVIGLLCGSAATIVLFCFWEARMGKNAMIPPALLKNRIVLASSGQMVCLMSSVVVGSTFLPIYFQSVRGATPTMSGVDLLPAILSQLLFAIISGAVVSKMGFYLPWAVSSGALTAIGHGLLSTLDAQTKTAMWIGFLIVLGAGRGSGLQMPMIATQSAVPPNLIPASLAFLIFVQNLGASVIVIIANTIFNQSLLSKLPRYAPSISPQKALEAGGSAEAVRNLLPPGHADEHAGVLRAYSESLGNVWYLMVGFSVAAFAFAWGTGWVDVRKKDGKDAGAAVVEEKGDGNETV
jgi:MFS family permease